MKTNYVLEPCPHCSEPVIIYFKDFNCKIFRHGVYKKDLKILDPHSSEEKCNMLKEKDLIFGCGKPFKLIKNEKYNEKYQLVKCDYI